MNHLIYLRTFLDTYRTGSLTRAAQRLGITQPSASAHIAALEQMLGKPLFLRQARGVQPTPAADDLAASIAAHLDGIEATFGATRARACAYRPATAPVLRILLEMVKAGAGWSVLPDYLCRSAMDAGAIVALQTERPAPRNTLYLAWNRPALRHPRVVHLRDFLLRAIRGGA